MALHYDASSPYFFTPIIGNFMGHFIDRPVLPHSWDRQTVLSSHRYHHRPDNLAKDIYNDWRLWWIFGKRNGFQDLVFDLKVGISLIIPHPTYVKGFT